MQEITNLRKNIIEILKNKKEKLKLNNILINIVEYMFIQKVKLRLLTQI